MHVTSAVVRAIIVPKAVEYRLSFELVFVCNYKGDNVKDPVQNTKEIRLSHAEGKRGLKAQSRRAG